MCMSMPPQCARLSLLCDTILYTFHIYFCICQCRNNIEPMFLVLQKQAFEIILSEMWKVKKKKDLWLEHWTNNSLTSILSIILHLQEQIFTESASYVPNILCLKEKQNSCWSVYDRPCKVWVLENILANLSILVLPELQLS